MIRQVLEQYNYLVGRKCVDQNEYQKSGSKFLQQPAPAYVADSAYNANRIAYRPIAPKLLPVQTRKGR